MLVREVHEKKAAICDEILRSLPDWFGIEQSIVDYVAAVDALPMFVVENRDGVIGFVTVMRHNEFTSEIHLIGVRKAYHRSGAGRALLHAAETHVRSSGGELLMVKTLGPSRENAEYARTRRFYEGTGFRPLEEFKTLWNKDNPCLVLVKPLR